jgi:hypothetical protein
LTGPEREFTDFLPRTKAALIGRVTELALLDDSWQAHKRSIVGFVAEGGYGKSILVNEWLKRMKADHYRKARLVINSSAWRSARFTWSPPARRQPSNLDLPFSSKTSHSGTSSASCVAR